MGRVSVGVLFTVLAVVLFVLAALGFVVNGEDEHAMIAWGLAAYALGRIVP